MRDGRGRLEVLTRRSRKFAGVERVGIKCCKAGEGGQTREQARQGDETPRPLYEILQSRRWRGEIRADERSDYLDASIKL